MSILKTLTINGKKFQVKPVVPATSVTLRASAWQGSNGEYYQVVSVVGVTATTKVDLQLTDEQVIIFKDKRVTFLTENNGGVVTIKAIGDKLTNDYTLQATVTEVESDGTVIRGNVVATPDPRPNLNQTDPTKPDYVIGAAEFGEAFGAMADALTNATTALGNLDAALTTQGKQIQANTEAVAKVKMPEVTEADNGKFLRVTDGAWAAVSVESAEGASF